jgi:hypothetical protein
LVSTKAVPPGGETQVKATVNTKNRRGHLKKTVSVHSNDPETPRLTLVLEAEITTDLIATPYRISFGQLAKGEKAEREIAIRSSDPERIRIVSLSIKDKRFKIKPKSKAPDNEQHIVRFLGSRTLERIAAAIEVEYQGAEQTSLSIPISVTVAGDLVYSKRLFFNKRNGAFSPRKVNFSSRSSKPFKLISAKDPAGLLKFTIDEPSGPRATLRVDVANPDASYVPPKRGVFTVNTNRRDERRIEIDYSIMERRVASPTHMTTPAKSRPVRPPLR